MVWEMGMASRARTSRETALGRLAQVVRKTRNPDSRLAETGHTQHCLFATFCKHVKTEDQEGDYRKDAHKNRKGSEQLAKEIELGGGE